jgi:hypothetical protein
MTKPVRSKMLHSTLGKITVPGYRVNLADGEIMETGSALDCKMTCSEELISRIGHSTSLAERAMMQQTAVKEDSSIQVSSTKRRT